MPHNRRPEDLQSGQHFQRQRCTAGKSGVQLKRSGHGDLQCFEGGIEISQQLSLYRSRAALHPRSRLVAVLRRLDRRPLMLGCRSLGLDTEVIHRRSGATEGPCDLVWFYLPLR